MSIKRRPSDLLLSFQSSPPPSPPSLPSSGFSSRRQTTSFAPRLELDQSRIKRHPLFPRRSPSLRGSKFSANVGPSSIRDARFPPFAAREKRECKILSFPRAAENLRSKVSSAKRRPRREQRRSLKSTTRRRDKRARGIKLHSPCAPDIYFYAERLTGHALKRKMKIRRGVAVCGSLARDFLQIHRGS